MYRMTDFDFDLRFKVKKRLFGSLNVNVYLANSTTFNEILMSMIYVGSNTVAFNCKHGHSSPEIYSITNLVEV